MTIYPVNTLSACIPCWQMTPAISSQLISMRLNGEMMHWLSCNPVMNWPYPLPLKYRVPAMARMLGFSFLAASLLAMRADWVLELLATPAPALDN